MSPWRRMTARYLNSNYGIWAGQQGTPAALPVFRHGEVAVLVHLLDRPVKTSA